MKYTIYTRKLKTLVDVLSTLGGLWGSVYAIGLGFTLAFSYNLMMSSLIRQLYHFDPHPEEKGVSDKPFKKKSKDKNEDFIYGKEDNDDDENLKKSRKEWIEKKLGNKKVVD